MTLETEIEIPDIEKALDQAREKGKQPKACLFTLIIYAKQARQVQYFQELVETILDKFPCRIIFIQGNNESERNYLKVNVSSVSSGSEGEAKVACDQITILTTKEFYFRIPFLVIPHIVPDLPVYLLWGQNPFIEHEIFPHLQPFASRVVFDSECAENFGHFCEEMRANLDHLNMDIMDINWALVSNWRDMLSVLFDTSEKVSELNECKTIAIVYNNRGSVALLHPEILAIYLQGWLAASFKWQYHQIDKFPHQYVISYESPKSVILIPQEYPELPSGSIFSLEITLSNGHSFYISRKPNLSQVVVHESTLEKCELPFTLSLPSVRRGMHFLKEIFYNTIDENYRETLKAIGQINYQVFK